MQCFRSSTKKKKVIKSKEVVCNCTVSDSMHSSAVYVVLALVVCMLKSNKIVMPCHPCMGVITSEVSAVCSIYHTSLISLLSESNT